MRTGRKVYCPVVSIAALAWAVATLVTIAVLLRRRRMGSNRGRLKAEPAEAAAAASEDCPSRAWQRGTAAKIPEQTSSTDSYHFSLPYQAAIRTTMHRPCSADLALR